MAPCPLSGNIERRVRYTASSITPTAPYPPILTLAPMHSYIMVSSVVHSKFSSPTHHKILFIIMAFADLHVMGPAKQVERSDRQLQHAQALYEGYQALMSPQDRDLAQDLLTYSGDLRCGWEGKYLPARIRQARLYCSWANDTLQKIQVLRQCQKWSICEPTASNSDCSSDRSTIRMLELTFGNLGTRLPNSQLCGREASAEGSHATLRPGQTRTDLGSESIGEKAL
ncbi:hypothetical protein V8E53_001618 [Lactarius tabidus]